MRMPSGATSPAGKSKRPITGRHGHKEWESAIEADWQNHLQTLQQCLGELLRKNQQMRVALGRADEPRRGYGHAIGL